ncbi:hypothetical protein ABPG72_015047 [Tetrahymena utriculariae]
MFQPNSIRALRELKLDKELEKNSMMQQQQNNSLINIKKSRSVSNSEIKDSKSNCDSSDFSEDDDSQANQVRPQTTDGSQNRGIMQNNSEYFQMMKSLLEKNPYHPMNFIFDHKDLIQDLNQFIQETRQWREQQQKELEEQLKMNKQRAATSVEENEELQRKIKEQKEFEEYLEQVQQIQEQYNKDFSNYQKYMKKTDEKENTPSTTSPQANDQDSKLFKQIEDSKKKVSEIGDIEEYLQKAQIEVEYNKIKSETDKNKQINDYENDLNSDAKKYGINEDIMVGISEWEKQVDELLLNLNEKPNDITLSSKQRIQSARQNLKKEYVPTNNDQLDKDLEELDKEFQELEEMLEDVSTSNIN